MTPKKFRVLIVEDDEDERFFMKESFHSTGLFDIVADACNGNEMFDLLDKANTPLPEVIVTDLSMMGKDGFDILKEMKNKPALYDVPVIVLSCAPKKPFADKCKNLGAHKYFNKPNTMLEYKNLAQTLYDTVASYNTIN